MDRVYRLGNPALFLSSFADFVQEHKQHEYMAKLVNDGFDLLFETYFVPLRDQHQVNRVNFTGSVAANNEEWLRACASKHDMEVSVIIKEPIHNLLNYYLNKN